MPKSRSGQEASPDIWVDIAMEWATTDEAAVAHLYRPIYMVMEKFLPLEKGMLVLEPGCGSGALSIFMGRKWGVDCICMDFALDCLKLAKKKHNDSHLDGNFILADINCLPFKDGAFDMVFNEGVIEHFTGKERQHVLNEMARVSRRYVAVFVPNSQNIIRTVWKHVKIAIRKWYWGLEIPYSHRELERAMEIAGLKVTKKAGVNFYLTLYGYWPFRVTVHPILRRLFGDRLFTLNAKDDPLNRLFGDEIFQLAVKKEVIEKA